MPRSVATNPSVEPGDGQKGLKMNPNDEDENGKWFDRDEIPACHMWVMEKIELSPEEREAHQRSFEAAIVRSEKNRLKRNGVFVTTEWLMKYIRKDVSMESKVIQSAWQEYCQSDGVRLDEDYVLTLEEEEILLKEESIQDKGALYALNDESNEAADAYAAAYSGTPGMEQICEVQNRLTSGRVIRWRDGTVARLATVDLS